MVRTGRISPDRAPFQPVSHNQQDLDSPLVVVLFPLLDVTTYTAHCSTLQHKEPDPVGAMTVRWRALADRKRVKKTSRTHNQDAGTARSTDAGLLAQHRGMRLPASRAAEPSSGALQRSAQEAVETTSSAASCLPTHDGPAKRRAGLHTTAGCRCRARNGACIL